jgi:hypothetical protein
MKTQLQILRETIEKIPTETITADTVKGIILDLITNEVIQNEVSNYRHFYNAGQVYDQPFENYWEAMK